MEEDLIYTMALMNIKGIGSIYARHLIDIYGSAKAVFETDPSLFKDMPRIGPILYENIQRTDLFEKAKREMDFIQAHKIKTLLYGAQGYPTRLLDCSDAPVLLFSMGNADLNSQFAISIVGTRRCSNYGTGMVHELVGDLAQCLPNVLIVSGLALGIDVSAHKSALDYQVPTVGVIAHGLDRIYPAVHRNIAKQMLSNGGLVTEYTTGTDPERGNFLARNRIIAGMSDVTIIAESSDKGGSMVTASIATSYDREVAAFPGRCHDMQSVGCNRLIKHNRAALITCAQDLIELMGWNFALTHPIPRPSQVLSAETLYAKRSPVEKKIVNYLKAQQIAKSQDIAEALGIPNTIILEAMLSLELDDIVVSLPGNIYQLQNA